MLGLVFQTTSSASQITRMRSGARTQERQFGIIVASLKQTRYLSLTPQKHYPLILLSRSIRRTQERKEITRPPCVLEFPLCSTIRFGPADPFTPGLPTKNNRRSIRTGKHTLSFLLFGGGEHTGDNPYPYSGFTLVMVYVCSPDTETSEEPSCCVGRWCGSSPREVGFYGCKPLVTPDLSSWPSARLRIGFCAKIRLRYSHNLEMRLQGFGVHRS